MVRLRSSTLRSLHEFFQVRHGLKCCHHRWSHSTQANAFTYAHTPLITSNDCEGAGETFNVSVSSMDSGQPLSLASSPSLLTSFFGGTVAYNLSVAWGSRPVRIRVIRKGCWPMRLQGHGQAAASPAVGFDFARGCAEDICVRKDVCINCV